jgi:hypothetical protein
LSTARTKPRSVQKLRSWGHSFSGGSVLTSQRWLPWRSTRSSPRVVGAVTGVALGADAGCRCCIAVALTTPDCGW